MTRKQEELSYKILQHIDRSLRSNKDEIDEYLHTEEEDGRIKQATYVKNATLQTTPTI